MKNTQKGSTVVVLSIIIIIILLGVISYSYLKPEPQSQQIQRDSYPLPVILTSSPQKGKIGTTVMITGKNLLDNRGEQNVVIVNSDGIKGYLYQNQKNVVKNNNDTWTIEVVIDSEVCSNRLTDRGFCDSYIKLIPGNYLLYIDHTNISGNHISNTSVFVLE